MTEARLCRTCGETDAEKFGYHRHRCKPCVNARALEYRSTHRESERNAQRARRERDPELHKRYAFVKQLKIMGLTPEAYDALCEAQGNRCAVCRHPEPRGMGRWHVDHDHACCPGPRSCGACVRGLLCFNCNIALGYFHDDRALLSAAIDYLDRNKEQ